MQREIFDISTSGFSIFDKSDEAVLMPGIILPDVVLSYAGILKIRCKAQVIYRREEEGQVRFGLVILDTDIANYKHLNQVINQMGIRGSFGSSEVDLDALWEFLFEADFIYPQKYKFVYSFKKEFQEVFRRLYEESPEVAAHFTYQQNGRVYGHISGLRAYERVWMIHHHAARPCDGRPVGLIVLKQMLQYVYDLCRLPSINMDYIVAYFRPENEFPALFFGDSRRTRKSATLFPGPLLLYEFSPEGNRGICPKVGLCGKVPPSISGNLNGFTGISRAAFLVRTER